MNSWFSHNGHNLPSLFFFTMYIVQHLGLLLICSGMLIYQGLLCGGISIIEILAILKQFSDTFSNNGNLLPSTFFICLHFGVKPSGLGAWIFLLSRDLFLKYFGCWVACSCYQGISYTGNNIATYPYHCNQWYCYLVMRLLGFRCLLWYISYTLGWCFYSSWRRVFCQRFSSPYLQKRKNCGYIFCSESL